MSRVALPVAAAALLLAGCFGSDSSEGVIPWTASRPTTKPSSPVPLAPPCRAGELHARLAIQGAGGSLVGGVVLRNSSAAPCSLKGRPDVELVDRAAGSTRWKTARGNSIGAQDGIAAPLTSLRALQPGTAAWVALFWSNWCPPGTVVTASGPAPRMLVLTLPRGGGAVRFHPEGAPRCDAPDEPSVISVAPFRPRAEEPPKSTRLPLRVSFPGVAHPEVKLGTPELQAARGGVLRYEIGLTNVSAHSFTFGACPVFVEKLSPAGRAQAFVLNCKPAGTFEPGERKIFAMELTVPSDAPLGRSGLTWALGPRTFDPPWAPATVLVTP